jgi:hypothetical protein
MSRPTTGFLAVLMTLLLATGQSASAIMIDQIDDFQDGTVAGWSHGASSPTPPVNIPSGGPAGQGDAYLENISSGFLFGAGSRMVMFNTDQWTGDYTEQGVVRIVADMLNAGQNDVQMRVALGGGSTNAQLATWYASADPVSLAADGLWRRGLSFPVTEESLTLVTGTIPLEEVLADVTMVRILSAAEPDFKGDPIAATLGFDNIAARAAGGGGEPLLGDMDGNGVVDFSDVGPYVLALDDPVAYAATYQMPPAQNGDTDGDGNFDFDDTPGFVALIEPSGGGLLGDVNLDSAVNGLDVDPFVTVLLSGSYQFEADMNQDTVVNGLDVDPFVAAILGGGLHAVPEPSGLILALAGLATLGLLQGGHRRGKRR